MTEQLKFIAYTDIHYSKLGARCITIDDCAQIEAAVHQRAGEWGADFTIFLGDRFLKREPEDETKVRADRIFKQSFFREAKYHHYHLIGNHDWTTNNREWHTSESLLTMNAGGHNFMMMGEPNTYSYDYCDHLIHALPAGFTFDFSKYTPRPDLLNIFVFHDMLYGSKLDDDGKATAQSGLSMPEMDRAEFDLVLAGDIHVPQRIPFKNTQGMYLGAVMQRTMADSNRPRGWTEFTATQDGGKWSIEAEFVPTRNFFTRISFEVGDTTEFSDLKFDEDLMNDCLVEVKLSGSKKNVDRVADDPRWSNYAQYFTPRGFDVTRNYQIEQGSAVVELSQTHDILEDLDLYLGSGFVDLGNLEKDKIIAKVQQLKE